MKLTEARLKEIWQGQTARATPRQAECLTEEQFVRVVTGEAPSQERAQAASHLASCSDCAEEYRLLRSLRPLAEQAEAILAASDGAPEIGQRPRAVGSADARPAAFWRSFASLVSPARATFALAALLLVSMALGLWLVLLRQGNDREIARLNRELAERDQALASISETLDETRRRLDETIRRSEQEKSAGDSKRYEDEIARLRQTVTELSRPQLDAPIEDLYPSDQTRGNTTGDAARIEGTPSANIITLILNITGQPSHSTYAVEILDSNGKQVWRGQRARNGPDHVVNLTLARRMIPAGRYLIKLFGLRDGKQEPVADYPVLIVYR
ncbi:MAG TPA: hypothetical protein VG324_15380 [Blastocatellia bacterium]|nr:hypothetical protein [Blastocatellia bacterium]